MLGQASNARAAPPPTPHRLPPRRRGPCSKLETTHPLYQTVVNTTTPYVSWKWSQFGRWKEEPFAKRSLLGCLAIGVQGTVRPKWRSRCREDAEQGNEVHDRDAEAWYARVYMSSPGNAHSTVEWPAPTSCQYV